MRHSFWGESVVAYFHGLEQFPLETIAHPQSPASFYHDDVLIYGMRVRHDDVSRLGMNANNEWLTRLRAIATYRLNPFVHGDYGGMFQRHDVGLNRLLRQSSWLQAEVSPSQKSEDDRNLDNFSHEVPPTRTS
jgi:hypothetical protein